MNFGRNRAALAMGMLTGFALILGGCELREDGAEPDPAPSETPSPDGVVEAPAMPEPTPSQTQGASIIRQDVAPAEEFEIPVPPYSGTIPFAEGGTDLSPAAETALAGVLASDAISEGWPIILRGHSDSGGNDQANMRVSRARAETVAAWLVERGINDARIEVIAFGEQNPIAPNALPDGSANEPGRRQNRRVEVEIAAPQSANSEPSSGQG